MTREEKLAWWREVYKVALAEQMRKQDAVNAGEQAHEEAVKIADRAVKELVERGNR
jgi:hypothetical protein